MAGASLDMIFIGLYKGVNLIVIRRWRFIVGMFAVFKICLFAIAECSLPHGLHIGKVVEIIAAEVMKIGTKAWER